LKGWQKRIGREGCRVFQEIRGENVSVAARSLHHETLVRQKNETASQLLTHFLRKIRGAGTSVCWKSEGRVRKKKKRLRYRDSEKSTARDRRRLSSKPKEC